MKSYVFKSFFDDDITWANQQKVAIRTIPRLSHWRQYIINIQMTERYFQIGIMTWFIRNKKALLSDWCDCSLLLVYILKKFLTMYKRGISMKDYNVDKQMKIILYLCCVLGIFYFNKRLGYKTYITK